MTTPTMPQQRGPLDRCIRAGSGCGFLVLTVVFLAGVLANIELPGLYADAVNPDYVAAVFLQGKNWPSSLLPSGDLPPALGGPYHGVQHLYLGLPFFKLFGTNIVTLRVFHALFGLGIVLATFALASRLGVARWMALAAATCLALDPTFLYAFRTQLYITIAPLLWWLLAVLLLLGRLDGARPSQARLLGAGALCGFAFYGYFIYLFLAPPALALAIASAAPGQRLRTAAVWGVGFLIGTLPYFYGYAAWAYAVGDLGTFLEALQQAFGAARPAGQSPDLAATLARSWHLLTLAVTGQAVQLIMLSSVTPGPKEIAMPWLLLAPVAMTFLPAMRTEARERVAEKIPGLAIASFLVLGAFFVGRMWAHHFAILMPLLYVGCALILTRVARLIGLAGSRPLASRVGHGLAAAATIAMLSLNAWQNVDVQSRLVATGGVSKYSDAINMLAEDALRQDQPLYVLHEWGFMMPLAFLAASKIEIWVAMNEAAVRGQLCQGRSVFSAYWIDPGVNGRIEADRARLGARVDLERTYRQRDGVEVIRLVKYGPPAEPGACPAGKPSRPG